MSGPSTGTVDWVAQQATKYLLWQVRKYRQHYLSMMGDNPAEYIAHALRANYCAATRGKQRRYRCAPGKLANATYYRIDVELRGRP